MHSTAVAPVGTLLHQTFASLNLCPQLPTLSLLLLLYGRFWPGSVWPPAQPWLWQRWCHRSSWSSWFCWPFTMTTVRGPPCGVAPGPLTPSLVCCRTYWKVSGSAAWMKFETGPWRSTWESLRLFVLLFFGVPVFWRKFQCLALWRYMCYRTCHPAHCKKTEVVFQSSCRAAFSGKLC